MLTKVGRSRTMLICSDCGHPQAPEPDQTPLRWQQLSSVLLLLVIGGVALALSFLSDRLSRGNSPLNEPASLERRD